MPVSTSTIVAVSDPSHGSASLTGGKARYTPFNEYAGADDFTYTISDGHGGTHAHGRPVGRRGQRPSVVVFETAEPLESGDIDSSRDVYKRAGGVISGITTSRDGAFDANFEAVNSTGSRIAFTTAEPSCGSVDVDAETDVYTHQAAGGTVCNSANGNGPFPAKFAAIGPGTTFYTTQEAVASQDGDEATDVYSDNAVVSQGAINGNGGFPAKFAAISADASRVFFTSFEQLVPQDVDDRSDIYMRSGSTTSLISIEVVPPVATITAGVADAGFTKDDTPVFEFTSSEPGSTFACTVDGSGPAPCSSPKVLGPLTDGPTTSPSAQRTRRATRRGSSLAPSRSTRSLPIR